MYPSVRSVAAVLASLLVPGGFAVPQATTTTGTTTAPTAAVIQTTISGTPTIIQVPLPTTTGTSTGTSTGAAPADSTQRVEFPTNLQTSDRLPTCNDTSPRFGPFCSPGNASEVYAGLTYYITWDTTFFSPNSNVTVLLNYANETKTQLWSSQPTQNNVSFTTLTFQKDWLQGFPFVNLSLIAMEYDSTTSGTAKFTDGPIVMLSSSPVVHYAPPDRTKLPNKAALLIGLPVSLGFVALVLFGLCIGMRSKRQIGIKNIMRRKRGYKIGGKTARRNRLDLSKGGVIRLQERELTIEENLNQYTDEAPGEPNRGKTHAREPSLGSLVSTESEVERQRTRGERYAPSAFRAENGKMRSWR